MKKFRMLSLFLCIFVLFGSVAVLAFADDSISPYSTACPECDDRLHIRNYYHYKPIDIEKHGYYRHVHRECNVCDYTEADINIILIRTDPHDDYPCSICYLGYCEGCMPANAQ